MLKQSTRNFPSATEAKCPDCGTTLSRKSDLKRHRKTQHPDGTEVKAHCPYSGCQYRTDQRSNLKAHIYAKHSNGYRYPCPDCYKGFTDPATRIRHRKKAHGYQPHHTPRYMAKQALREAEMKRIKAALNQTGNQQVTSVVPHNSQNASSSADTLGNLLANATYHNDFWKLLVDAPRRGTSDLKGFQDAQIRVPVATEPAPNTPNTLHSDSNFLSPKVAEQPSTTQNCDGIYTLGPQLDTTVQPQSQALAQSWSTYGRAIHGMALDHRPFAPTFPTSGGQATYPGMGFQSLPAFSFTNAPSSIPNSFNFPTTSTAPSSRISGHQFVSPNHVATLPPLEPVPTLSWTPSLSSANPTPVSQTEFFTGEPNRSFNTWCPSHDFA